MLSVKQLTNKDIGKRFIVIDSGNPFYIKKTGIIDTIVFGEYIKTTNFKYERCEKEVLFVKVTFQDEGCIFVEGTLNPDDVIEFV